MNNNEVYELSAYCVFTLLLSMRQRILFDDVVPVNFRCEGWNVVGHLYFQRNSNSLTLKLGVADIKGLNVNEFKERLKKCAEALRASLIFSKYKLLFREMIINECKYPGTMEKYVYKQVLQEVELPLDTNTLSNEVKEYTERLLSPYTELDWVLRALQLLYLEGFTDDLIIRTIVVGDAIEIAINKLLSNLRKAGIEPSGKNEIYRALGLSFTEEECKGEIRKYTLRDLRNALVHGKEKRGLDIEEATRIVEENSLCIENIIVNKAVSTIKEIALNPEEVKSKIIELIQRRGFT